MRPARCPLHPGREALLLALFLFILPIAGADDVSLVVLHTADLHGRVFPSVPAPGVDPEDGGWLRIATRIRQVREESEHVILLDAGDTIQGSPESHATKGREMVAALERAGYDAWVLGNHEFDWGYAHLQTLLQQTRLTVLAADLGGAPGTPSPLPNVRPYTILHRAGVRIAIVGLSTPGLPNWFVPELLGPVEVADPVAALHTLMPILRVERPDIRILVLHQGYRGGATGHAHRVALLLRRFPEFDVVIGGHTHEFIPGLLINGVLYAQSGYHGAALGRVDLVFNRRTGRVTHKEGRLLPADREVPPDPSETEAWTERRKQTHAHLAAPVGRLAAPLSARAAVPGQSGVERLLRAAIGIAVQADIVIHGVLSQASLPAGEIIERDLWRIVPYENRIGVTHLTLREIRAILEDILALPKSPRFMGISGLIVEIDPDAPAGDRVLRMRFADGRRAHGRKRYRVAFNSYTLASAGGRYPRLREITQRPRSRLDLTHIDTRTAVRAYLATHPDLALSHPPPDGYRIRTPCFSLVGKRTGAVYKPMSFRTSD